MWCDRGIGRGVKEAWKRRGRGVTWTVQTVWTGRKLNSTAQHNGLSYQLSVGEDVRLGVVCLSVCLSVSGTLHVPRRGESFPEYLVGWALIWTHLGCLW